MSWALCASALLHLGVVTALRELAPSEPRSSRTHYVDEEVAFEALPTGTSRGALEALDAPPPLLIPGGPALLGALDRAEQEGRGGELQALEPGALLFPFVAPVTLQDTELNNLAVNQVQRINTAPERATLEQRRATPHPADEVLLVSGEHGHAERREPARQDSTEGVVAGARASAPSEASAGLATGPTASDAPRPIRRAARLRPAQGILKGRGQREHDSAKVAFARPNVDPAAAAIPAEQRDPRIRDDVDSELLAAKLQRSFVDTSVQRAQRVGPGSGGAALDPRAFGVQGAGSGSRARPYAPGSGNFNALDTGDARYLRWFTQQRARVQRELVFPRERAIAKDQGTSLYRVVLARDGGLSGKPRLVRSSGYADFDRAAATAIERALPFAPLPDELAPELVSIALLIPVAFSNPMVQ